VQPAIDAVRNGDVPKFLPEQDKKKCIPLAWNIEPLVHLAPAVVGGHQIPVWFDDEGKGNTGPPLTEAESASKWHCVKP